MDLFDPYDEEKLPANNMSMNTVTVAMTKEGDENSPMGLSPNYSTDALMKEIKIA